MAYDGPNRRRKRRVSPLDTVRLEELALAYVARFATSAAKLENYLKRKLRERGWEGEGEPDPAEITARYVELGYIDDASYARARAGGLLQRGYGPQRVDQALRSSGIDEDVRQEVAPKEAISRAAVLRMAEKRRFGPFADAPADRPTREKQLAAMVRAGHSFDMARKILDAANIEEAREWAEELDEDD